MRMFYGLLRLHNVHRLDTGLFLAKEQWPSPSLDNQGAQMSMEDGGEPTPYFCKALFEFPPTAGDITMLKSSQPYYYINIKILHFSITP